MINPVGTKVVIRRLKERLESSTIILDETVAERESQAAEVIAVGRGITLRDVEYGDILAVGRNDA